MGSAVGAIFDPAGIFFKGGNPILQRIADPLGIFKTPELPTLPKPPKPPSADDPAIAAAQKKAAAAARARKGRKASIISGGAGITEDAPLSQPKAGSAELLGT